MEINRDNNMKIITIIFGLILIIGCKENSMKLQQILKLLELFWKRGIQLKMQ
jgi:hypothetical protein